MSHEIKIVRLLGQQDVIAKVELRNKDGRLIYRLKDVLGLMMVPKEKSALANPNGVPEGGVDLQFYPYLPVYTNPMKYIETDSFHVMFTADPHPQVLDQYNRMTSGLILPKSSGLTSGELEVQEDAPEVKLEEVETADVVKIEGSGDFNQQSQEIVNE